MVQQDNELYQYVGEKFPIEAIEFLDKTIEEVKQLSPRFRALYLKRIKRNFLFDYKKRFKEQTGKYLIINE